jgi:predicted glycoside hydrolase/deacetylase ChbG (UPF0249 family)
MTEPARPALTPPNGRRLILNADDFGLSPGLNRAIVDLHAAGVVTSASLLMNLPSTAEALALSAGSDLDIAVHLNLTAGRPLRTDVPSLIGADGRFRDPVSQTRRLLAGQLRLDEVEREWATQIEAFLATGRPLAHLDSHTHVHALPGLLGVLLRLARRYGIGAVRSRGHGLVLHQAVPLVPQALVSRWQFTFRNHPTMPLLTSDHLLVLTAMGARVGPDDVARLLRGLEPGLTELVTHAGYVDDELRRLDTLLWEREGELRLLQPRWWRPLLADLGIQPTTFREELARLPAPAATVPEV